MTDTKKITIERLLIGYIAMLTTVISVMVATGVSIGGNYVSEVRGNIKKLNEASIEDVKEHAIQRVWNEYTDKRIVELKQKR